MLKKLTLLFLFAAILLPGFALDEQEENRSAISYLKGLQIEDLINVEVVLDDVFDVFDGLIKARKTTIATGETQSTSRAPAVTSVITAQDIEASGARDLAEILNTVPGLHVTKNAVYASGYAIRGLVSDNNFETLVMVNGVPIKTLFEGNRGIIGGNYLINSIARVEIIRGPGSAIYGADAFGGVINIITKGKEDINGTEVGTRVGSFNTQEVWALHGDTYKGFDVALTAEYQTTDGQRGVIEEDAQTQMDKLTSTHISLAPGPVNLAASHSSLRLEVARDHWLLRTGYVGRHNIGNGIGVANALDPGGFYDADDLNAELIYHNPQLTDYWDVTAQLSVLDSSWQAQRDHRLFPPGYANGAYPDGVIGNPGLFDRHTRLELSAFYAGFKKHLLRLGGGYHYGDLYRTTESKNFGIDPATGRFIFPPAVIEVSDTPIVFAKETTRENYYVYVQDMWRVASDWELTAGIRYDHYSDFGKTINPRLALVWQTRPYFTSKLLYGSAFREPTLGELYAANNPVQQGNPNVGPETIETWELAFDYRATETLHLALNLFRYEATDKILFISDPGKDTKTAQNIGTQTGRGGEFEVRWKSSKKSSMLFNYSFQDSVDDNDHSIARIPQQTAYLRTDWLLIPNWFLDAQLNWVADRKRHFNDSRSPVDDYFSADLTLRRKDIKAGHWNFAVGVRNLFDADAREPSVGPNTLGIVEVPYDFPLAGRHYFLELRYHF